MYRTGDTLPYNWIPRVPGKEKRKRKSRYNPWMSESYFNYVKKNTSNFPPQYIPRTLPSSPYYGKEARIKLAMSKKAHKIAQYKAKLNWIDMLPLDFREHLTAFSTWPQIRAAHAKWDWYQNNVLNKL